MNTSRRYPSGNSEHRDDEPLRLDYLVSVLSASRGLIVGLSLLVALAGAAYAFLVTPVYVADALLQVDEKDTSLGAIDLAELIEGNTSVNTEIEIIRSRSVLAAVVDSLDLDINAAPKYFPIFGKAFSRLKNGDDLAEIQVDRLEVTDDLTGFKLRLVNTGSDSYALYDPDGEKILDGKVGEAAASKFREADSINIFVAGLKGEENQVYEIVRRSYLESIEELKGRLTVTERGKSSGVLVITLEGENPGRVSRELNEIVNTYLQKNVERRSAEASQTLKFLEKQLPKVKQEMETAELELNTYRLEKGSVDLPLETQAILSTAVDLEKQYNELLQEREKTLQQFTTAHQFVIALDKQIAYLAGELRNLDSEVKELPGTQQEVLRLYRDVNVSTDLYASLLNSAQELNIVKAGTVGNVRIVDFAVPPFRPSKPRKAMVVLMSLMLGAFFGIVAAFLRDALHTGVADPDLIEDAVGIPVFAVIPYSSVQAKIGKKVESAKGKAPILALAHPSDIAVESIRNIRTSLLFATDGVPGNTILVAGPGPDVGKSFVSVNLAAVLADEGGRVLLVDGDLRMGRLHRHLGFARTPGLSQLVSENLALEDVVQQAGGGFDFIANGPSPQNPSALLLNDRFRIVLNELSEQYDHVIIDTPPMLAVTDATIIGQVAHAALLVLRADRHSIREIEQSVKRLQQANVHLRGLIINIADRSARRYSAGPYSYYHGAGQNAGG